MSKGWTGLSVLIAGCGSIGRRHARVLREMGLQDIRACDPSPESRRAMQETVLSTQLYDSYEAGLATGPDTVFICTPSHLHVPMAIAAVRNDIHVMCEKPLSTTTEGIDELERIASERDIKVMVGLCFRYHEGIRKAYEYVQTRRVGRIVSIRSIVGEHLPSVRHDYRTVHSSGSLGAFDLMHDLDLALWMADDRIKECHCVYGTYSDIGIEAPDLVEFLIAFENSCTATVHLDFFHQPRRREFDLICAAGVISVEFSKWDTCTVSLYDGMERRWLVETFETKRDDMFEAEDTEFLRAVHEDRPVACSIRDGRKTVELISQAIRSRTSDSARS